MNVIPNADDKDFPAYGSTPLLVAYILFVAMTLLASVAFLLVPQIGEFASPYFGHPVIGLFYAGNLVFVIMKLVAPNSYANDKFLHAMRNLLGIIAVFGILLAALSWLGGNYNNPYLTVHAIQPFWTVGVPIAWYLVLRRYA